MPPGLRSLQGGEDVIEERELPQVPALELVGSPREVALLLLHPGGAVFVHVARIGEEFSRERRVELLNTGTMPWTPTGAALVGSKREALTVWPLEPIPPGKFQSITVEMNAAESEARGTYTLKLWGEQGGTEGVTLDGVTFP